MAVVQLKEVEAVLLEMHQAGDVVVFEWLQWLQYSLLDHLGASESLDLHAHLSDLYVLAEGRL